MLDGDEVDKADTADGRSLLDDIGALVDDGRVAFEAEINFQKSRLAFCATAGKRLAIFGVAALFFAFFFLVALTVGLLLALTPLVGAWGAMAIVAGGLLMLALICALLANSCFGRIVATFKDDEA